MHPGFASTRQYASTPVPPVKSTRSQQCVPCVGNVRSQQVFRGGCVVNVRIVAKGICCFVRAPGDTYIWKLHFWIIYNTRCWFNMLLCPCTMSHLCLEVTFLDHFCEHESLDHFFFGTYIFGSFFYTNFWINMVLCTCTMCCCYYPLDHHVFALMVQEIVDHFARQWGGGDLWGR